MQKKKVVPERRSTSGNVDGESNIRLSILYLKVY